MISFDAACETVGYVRRAQCPIVREYIYFAYKDGKVVKFSNKTAALAYSTLVESKCTNQVEYDKWWEDQRILENTAQAIWFEALKEEWVSESIPEKLFDLCYSEAYEQGHSSGYDEVASCMHGIVDFAVRVRNLYVS